MKIHRRTRRTDEGCQRRRHARDLIKNYDHVSLIIHVPRRVIDTFRRR